MAYSLPATIKALQSQNDFTVKLIDIPFATQERVQNLPDNEILIKVRAVGINPTDWKHSVADVWGYPGNIVGCDAAGDVIKVGSAVDHVKVGDRVFGWTYGSGQKDNGAYAEYVRLRHECTFVLPPGMSYAEAAAFPIPHLTAVQGLYFRLSLPRPSRFSEPPVPGSRGNLLVWGGASAVGHHVIQLAKLSGFRVVTTASSANHAYLKSIGADVTIDYRDKDVLAQIRDAVKIGGLKYAFDPIAENNTTDLCVDAIDAPEGYVIVTLPASPETLARRKNVKVEFILAYTLITDVPFVFGRVVDIPVVEDDRENAKEWVTKDLPKILDRWVEGEGTKGYKPQRLRIGYGPEKVGEGLQYMEEGKVHAEKLVYIIN